MKQIINKLTQAFEYGNHGFSSRKLAAFTAVVTAIFISYYLPESERIHAIYVWLTFALLCLGIVTAQQVLQFKKENGSDTKRTDEQ